MGARGLSECQVGWFWGGSCLEGFSSSECCYISLSCGVGDRAAWTESEWVFVPPRIWCAGATPHPARMEAVAGRPTRNSVVSAVLAGQVCAAMCLVCPARRLRAGEVSQTGEQRAGDLGKDMPAPEPYPALPRRCECHPVVPERGLLHQ